MFIYKLKGDLDAEYYFNRKSTNFEDKVFLLKLSKNTS